MNIIVAGNIPAEIQNSLKKIGFNVLLSPPNPHVLPGLKYHPDMQIVSVDDCLVCDSGLYGAYCDILGHGSKKLLCGKTQSQCTYPKDVAYNIKVVGKYVFHNFRYTDEKLKEVVAGKTPVNVSQGYTGCSICTVSDSAIITADRVIHENALSLGVDSLLVSEQGIKLDFFNYGFIGGSSFLCDGKLYFFGDISFHPDCRKIKDFCKKHGTEICVLGTDVLSDYGSAITF